MQVKMKSCRLCGAGFVPRATTQVACSPRCAIEISKQIQIRKENRAWNREKKLRKERLKTHSEWLKDLQKVFNAYIRKRDEDQGCISCGTPVKGNGHASHFFSVGAFPNLRFNEDNVWRSCVECNLHKHGNTAEYSVRLREKIGAERFNKLMELRNEPLKLSVPEIQEKIKHYKNLCNTKQK